jgi:hypothetical protein
MEVQYVIKCSVCKKLKTLENYGCKYRITDAGRVLVKNKICIDCLQSVKDSYGTFRERYGMTYYRYRLNKS